MICGPYLLFGKLGTFGIYASEDIFGAPQFDRPPPNAWSESATALHLRQSNLQLQNEAALMSCRIRAVEHRKCAAGLAGAHPGLQDRILLNYTQELRMRIKYARKRSFFFIEVQELFFSLLKYYQMPECLYIKNCCFRARATVLSWYRN